MSDVALTKTVVWSFYRYSTTKIGAAFYATHMSTGKRYESRSAHIRETADDDELIVKQVPNVSQHNGREE